MPDSSLAFPLAGAVLVAVGGGVGFIWAQRRGAPNMARLGRRMAREWFPEAAGSVDALQGEFGRIDRRPLRLALGSTLHLAGWIGTGVAGWLAYRLLGADIDLPSVLALEALLNATLAAAFLVPGAVGVQEAGYALLGALFGLAPELSLGVSLLRRAKDSASWDPHPLGLADRRVPRRLRTGGRQIVLDERVGLPILGIGDGGTCGARSGAARAKRSARLQNSSRLL